MNKQIKNAVMGAAMAAAMLIGVAQAGEAPTQKVGFNDLNLNTDAGQQALYGRINGAANQVCRDLDGRDLPSAQNHKACVQRAIADAMADVNKQMMAKTVAVAQAH